MAAPLNYTQPSTEAESFQTDTKDEYKTRSTSPFPIPECRYHPAFCFSPSIFEDIPTITLCSTQGTLYAVPMHTLRTTSEFFATMFTLPSAAPLGILDVYEPDILLEPLLRIICGLSTPAWDSFEPTGISELFFLADRWAMPSALETLRPILSAPWFLGQNPLRAYALSVHFDWTPEIQLASSHTLDTDLLSPTAAEAEIIGTLAGPAFLALLRLHRTRLAMFRARLNSPERFLAGNSSPFFCSACARTPLDNSSWRALKARLIRCLEEEPSGEALGIYGEAVVGGMHSWPETKACWDARCVKADCGAKNYDQYGTIRQIKTCFEGLPSIVQVDWIPGLVPPVEVEQEQV
ncbi:F-box domain-containing protein [Mycena indigotica]|uniref:F-box domain-containing protein n=1 Tax=Mycena indigotica TaxID=2126181 RepID=A0A8H6T6F0_9AGAR|nr:F-box domain-containing protein [Mycena indigotica]KAF7311796.1 F-box domain-containing protein [Mycena indigotica]